MSKIYISLPISGRKLKDVKKQAAKAEKFLQSKGYKTVSPIEVSPNPQATYAEHMGRDIQALLECDGIYMCEGWEASKGCRAEHSVAMIYGRNIMYFTPEKEYRSGRTIEEVDRDIQACHEELRKAIYERRYTSIDFHQQRLDSFMEEKAKIIADNTFFEQNKQEDRNAISWAGKTLNLSLNTADMSIYYVEMFLAYFIDRGFSAVPEWGKRVEELRTALNRFSEYTRFFFTGKSRENNHEALNHLLDLVKEDFFTDREKVYYDKYEEMT